MNIYIFFVYTYILFLKGGNDEKGILGGYNDFVRLWRKCAGEQNTNGKAYG
jgi:hypothetical protein